ncbi:TPA: hypothetical protein ACGOWL_000299 [Streptococcus suis]
MKKTIWNASLEESMGLVTDRYIQTSMEDMDKNGYRKKILGFLTVEFFMFLFSFIGPYSDKEVGKILYVDAEILFSIPLWLGLIVIVLYLFDTRKIRHNRILSYYYFNKNMFLMMSLLNFQAIVLFTIGSAMFFGSLIAVILNLSIIIFVIVERYLWFKKEVLNGLYGNQSVSNPLNDVVEKFVVLGKKDVFFPEQKQAVYGAIKDGAYWLVDRGEEIAESTGKAIQAGWEELKSVGNNISEFFNGGAKMEISWFG